MAGGRRNVDISTIQVSAEAADFRVSLAQRCRHVHDGRCGRHEDGIACEQKKIIRGNPFPSGPATGGCSIPSTSQLVRQGRLGHPVSRAGTELGYCLQHRNPVSPEDLLLE